MHELPRYVSPSSRNYDGLSCAYKMKNIIHTSLILFIVIYSSHIKALDNKSRSAERNTPTNSIIYINTNRITRTHKTYNSGTLIHEIVHATDLANGNYHSSYPIREKRAVFFQNIWRNTHSKELRTSYHGRFETNEYQKSKNAGELMQDAARL